MNVYGPATFTAAAGKPQSVSQAIALSGPCDLTPDAVYTLVVKNDGVASASIGINGAEVVAERDFNAQVQTIERVVTLAAANTLTATIKGGTRDGTLTLTIRRHIDLTEPVFGEQTYTTTGKADQFHASFNAGAAGSYSIVVRHGSTKVNGGSIRLNGAEVVTQQELDAASVIRKSVALAAANELLIDTKSDGAGASLTVAVVRHLIDTAGPEIALSVTGGQIVPASPLRVTGTVTDPSGVAGFSVDGNPVPVGPAGAVSVDVVLSAGPNLLRFEATDCEDNVTRSEITVILNAAPLLGVTAPVAGSFVKPVVALSGTVTSAAGIQSVTADGTPMTVSGTSWSGTVTLTGADGSRELVVIATDVNGKQTTARVGVVLDGTAPSIAAVVTPPANAAGWHRTDATVAFDCSDATSGVATCTPDAVITAEGTAAVTGTAVDRAGNSVTVSVPVKIDTTAPTVVIGFPVDSGLSFASTVDVAGTVGDATSAVVRVTCNGTNGIVSGVSFACVNVPLTAGTNTVTVEAFDSAGNSAQAARLVTYIADSTPPTITARLSEPPNDLGWNRGPLSVTFVCADPGGHVMKCTDYALIDEAVDQTISGEVVDGGGNRATASVTVNVDSERPLLQLTGASEVMTALSSWRIAGTVSDAISGVRGVRCGGVEAELTGNAFECTVPLADGWQHIAVEATDRAGNTDDAVVAVQRDNVAPQLTILEPVSPANTSAPEVTIVGLISAQDEIPSVTVDGTAVPLAADDTFVQTVALVPGVNEIEVRAADAAGNAAVQVVTVQYLERVAIEITSPEDYAVASASTVTVTGSVSGPTSSIDVNGVQASRSGNTFSADVPLAQGRTVVTATATLPGGQIVAAHVHVYRDSIPPRVTIYSPADGATVATQPIGVAGMVDDIVIGTINAGQVQVTVNGIAATVANRMFEARNVPLTAGQNRLDVVATDQAGNVFTVSHDVTFTPNVPRVLAVSGNGQTGTIGALLPQPLRVRVVNAAGAAVPGVAVDFRVEQNDGVLTAGSGTARTLTVTTDAAGEAAVQWTLGHRAGAGNQLVRAYAGGYEAAEFRATATTGSAALIVVDSGNNQFGVSGEALPRPLVAVVVDSGSNRLGSVPVTFTATGGGGSFGGSPSVVVLTDSDGRAVATPRLGPGSGSDNNSFVATVDGVEGAASFVATGRPAGPVEETRISGVILDNTNIPVAGVTVRIDETTRSAVTNAQGHFTFTTAPVGYVKLIVDGSTAQRPGTWPTLEFVMYTNAGQDNTLGMPIYLLPIDVTRGIQVTETTGGTLVFPEMPGFSLTVEPGSALFPNGGRAGTVSATLVHADKMPMVPGFGQQPRFIVTIQPPGVHFDPPAAMTLPNLDGLAPGETTELYSFDHDLGQFVAIGTGTVSEDGTTVVSDPGVGIIKGGWHCDGNPAPTGTSCTLSLSASVDVSPDGPPAVTSTFRAESDSAAASAERVTRRARAEAVLDAPAVAAVGTCAKIDANGLPLGGIIPVGTTQYFDWQFIPESAVTRLSVPNCVNTATCTAKIRGNQPGLVTVKVSYKSIVTGQTKTAETKIRFVKVDLGVDELSFVDDIAIVKDIAPTPLVPNGVMLPLDDPVWANSFSANQMKPIAYKRGKTMVANVKFRINQPLDVPLSRVNIEGRVNIPGVGPKKFVKENVTIPSGQSSFEVQNIKLDWVPDKVAFYEPLQIAWKVIPTYDGGCPLTFDVGLTDVKTYITWDKPNTGSVVLSVLHLAVRGLTATTEDAVVEQVWRKFGTGSSPASPRTWDNRPLHYYQPGTRALENPIDLRGLLMKETGQCGSWYEFLKAALDAHGIDSDLVKVTPGDGIGAMLVKNFAFGSPDYDFDDEGGMASIFSPDVPDGLSIEDFNYRWIPPTLEPPTDDPADSCIVDMTASVAADFDQQVYPLEGIAGQGSFPQPSQKIFQVHFIVKVNGRYLDPSYGKEYTSEADFQNSSVAGFTIGHPSQPCTAIVSKATPAKIAVEFD
ncbi:MAG TPA: carboxypeptidase-like regulatory domain-containing protein [Thermoanaerobaculia bacterium]|nr:carboxypeptidase-like regulatory domain-containing protein [Thermoanaerobaculia bacterium]